MANKKNTHYNMDAIDKKGCIYNLIFGSRSDGKSYQVKHKKAVVKYVQTGRRFILIRRLKEEIKADKIERYFSDVDVTTITNGRYNCITLYRGELFLSNYDIETCKTTRGEKIGYVMALTSEQHYAGASYLDVDDMIFEEFMARSPYLHDEPDKLANLWSTVDRKRFSTRVWMVGNTISKVCPYYKDWGLRRELKTMKQGDIRVTQVPAGEDKEGNPIYVPMALEWCKSTGSNMAIGKHQQMLNNGAWQTDPQPHLPKSIREYRSRFCFMFVYQDFQFACSYLQDKETGVHSWFIKPYEGEIDDKTIVFSDQIKPSPYWQRDIYGTDFPNPALNDLFKTFRESNIFYASDDCGTDFKQVIDFTIRK